MFERHRQLDFRTFERPVKTHLEAFQMLELFEQRVISLGRQFEVPEQAKEFQRRLDKSIEKKDNDAKG